MDTKDIVEKALKGEDYKEDIKDFDETQLKDFNIALRDAAKAEAEAELAKVGGLRKERQRLETPPQKPEDSQMRVENIQLAKEEFFADSRFSLTDDEKVQFENEFKKLDSGKIAPKLIIADLKKAYVAVKGDELLNTQDKMKEFEKNAAEFAADNAGGSSGGGSPDESKFSQDAKDLHKRWVKQGIKGKTLEDAQKLIDRGEGWQGRDLSS